MLSEVYKGLGGEDRAGRNLRRFVEAHCLAESPWEEGAKVEALVGRAAWWAWEGGVKKVCASLSSVIFMGREADSRL